ncbi:MAG: hypothetical protein IT363_12240 [Methanoregulaceae archaeon]|nr:hypothetical protein [Methanoregulaceae archaeon]
MSLITRVVALLVALSLAAVGASVPVIWTKVTEQAGDPKIIRDSSGNFYHAVPTGTFFNKQVVITRYNAMGAVAWTRKISGSSSDGNQFSVRGLAATSTSLIVVLHERTNGGAGSFVSSVMYVYDLATGNFLLFSTSQSFEYSAPAASATQFAVMRRTTSTDMVSINFRQASGTDISTFNIGPAKRLGVVTMDSDGDAYTASGLEDGTALVSRYTADGMIFQTVFDAPDRHTETPIRIVADRPGRRVYVLAQTVPDLPNNVDAMLYVANLLTGVPIATVQVAPSSGDSDPQDLTLLPSSGVVASAATSNGITSVRRFGVNGNTVWTSVITQSPSTGRRSHAVDPDGNLLVLGPTDFGDKIRVDRLNMATGVLIQTHQHLIGFPAEPLQLLTDAAGSFFMTSRLGQDALFQLVQVADLTFSANNVTGGTAVEGRIDAGEAFASDRTWQITSSNPALASVPSSVILPASQDHVTFPITVSGATSNTNVSINVRHGGFISQKTLTVVQSNVQSVSITPQVVIGGVATTADLTLTGNAPTGGRTVTLSSNKPAVASVPASVNVPSGQSTHAVPVTTFGVNSNQGVVITATTGAVSRTAFFAVNAPSLTSISIAPGSIKGGLNATLTLNINGIAPTGGFSIVLFSGAPAIVILSASAGIPAGAVTHNVNVPTTAVTSSTNVLIFATRSGIYKTTSLTVTP